jgi:hypothetical protein
MGEEAPSFPTFDTTIMLDVHRVTLEGQHCCVNLKRLGAVADPMYMFCGAAQIEKASASGEMFWVCQLCENKKDGVDFDKYPQPVTLHFNKKVFRPISDGKALGTGTLTAGLIPVTLIPTRTRCHS